MEQLSIFDFITEDKPPPTDIKLLSLFSGIGAFEKALDRLGINYELVNYCEIDKHASRSYSAIHNVSEELNLWDVTKVDEKALPKDIDLLTYGFPCQDISLAGKQKGLFNEDGTKTRSGLFFDALRIIEETQPKVAIAENVKNLVGKKFSEQFKIVLDSLESAGYNNYYQVLNAKDYGIPQNRERVFIISIRKDIDNGMFEFPKGFPLEKRLKDVLEDTVDEKYYLSDKMIDYISQKGTKNFSNANCKINCTIARPLTTDQNKRAGTTNYLCENLPENFDINRIKVVVEPMAYDEQNQYVRQDGCVGTLTTDGSSPKHNNRVLVWDGYNQRIRADQSCVGTLTTMCGADLKRHGQGIIEQPLRIRKLTPLECWRLMDFDDEDYYKADKVNSASQLYKQAGNSIVVSVLEHLLKQVFKAI